MGTSTGGTLALQLAAAYPDIAGLILLSPNIAINDPNAWMLNDHWGLQIARLVKKSDYNVITGKDSAYKQYWYTQYRLEALTQLEELLETTMNTQAFSRVKQPVLMLYYYRDEQHQDPVVKVAAMKDMFEQLGTLQAQKKMEAIPNAGAHVLGSIIVSKDIPAVEAATTNFMQDVLMLKPVTRSLRNVPVQFGIIPVGSGNGLALAAGIPSKPQQALALIFAGKAAPVDAFMVNNEYSCMLSGIGFDAQVQAGAQEPIYFQVGLFFGQRMALRYFGITAAVILPVDFHHPLLNDSKQLSATQRESLRPVIESAAIAWAVAQVDNHEIDRINILKASYKAMHLSIDQLTTSPQLLLIDGNRFIPYRQTSHRCIVKGDGIYASIAAASILAKTYRDAFMQELHLEFPQYKWDRNKGCLGSRSILRPTKLASAPIASAAGLNG
eukprot:jgi/Mesen1/2829/ME001734S01993